MCFGRVDFHWWKWISFSEEIFDFFSIIEFNCTFWQLCVFFFNRIKWWEHNLGQIIVSARVYRCLPWLHNRKISFSGRIKLCSVKADINLEKFSVAILFLIASQYWGIYFGWESKRWLLTRNLGGVDFLIHGVYSAVVCLKRKR